VFNSTWDYLELRSLRGLSEIQVEQLRNLDYSHNLATFLSKKHTILCEETTARNAKEGK
jgi:hypothetical protein